VKRRMARRLAWSLWMLSLVLLVGLVAMGPTGRDEDIFAALALMVSVLAYATVGAMIASRHPGNAIGWLFQYFSVVFVISVWVDEYANYALQNNLRAGAAAALASQALSPLSFGAVPLILLLFPSGTLPSRRWRPVAFGSVVSVSLAAVGMLIRPGLIGGPEDGASAPNPLGMEGLGPVTGVLVWVGGVGAFLTGLLSVAGLVVRYRRADGEERQQIRWLAYVGALAAVLLVLLFVGDWIAPGVSDWFWMAFFATIALGIPAASGIAILRYRLFDLDIVVKKTVVFGILAAFITGAYILVVISIPTLLFGTGGGIRNTVPFLSAAVLALAFQPVRGAARRLANRLVYGRRATPYELLAEFGGRLGAAYSADDVLPRMARVVKEGTGAARASIWLRVGDELRPAASWPEEGDTEERAPASDDAVHTLGADRAFPVRHEGELLGALAVDMPRAEPLTKTTEGLLEDLAGQAALILRNVRLTRELRAKLEELRASRQRLVTAQDEERRRLERNIHDGAQQQLVALSVKARLLKTMARKDPAKAEELAEQLQADTQDALDDLRDLARGIYPPLLADQGLAAALESQARKVPFPVAVEPNGIGRYSADAETTAYFCVLEALQNAAKYANASRAVVRVSEEQGRLVFSVSDDGVGFEVERSSSGTGLQNMADRVEALGGSIELVSSPGRGTTVTGRIPVR
jgi:signal transduction histidine kinase